MVPARTMRIALPSMDNRPLVTETDYDAALREIAEHFEHQPDPGTPEAERFAQLARLIREYEDKHWPI